MILSEAKVREVIESQSTVLQFVRSRLVHGLLDDYVVADYITSENIPEITVDGEPERLSVDEFFDGHRHLMRIIPEEILSHFDEEIGNEYEKHTGFPYPFVLHFFDTFLVIEINPTTLETEFVVMAPMRPGEDDMMAALRVSIAITALVSSVANSSSQLPMCVRADEILEHLRV